MVVTSDYEEDVDDDDKKSPKKRHYIGPVSLKPDSKMEVKKVVKV